MGIAVAAKHERWKCLDTIQTAGYRHIHLDTDRDQEGMQREKCRGRRGKHEEHRWEH